ncbi:hypothetical protein AAE478_003412 [Parahypoxylon ruwenzoriense]
MVNAGYRCMNENEAQRLLLIDFRLIAALDKFDLLVRAPRLGTLDPGHRTNPASELHIIPGASIQLTAPSARLILRMVLTTAFESPKPPSLPVVTVAVDAAVRWSFLWLKSPFVPHPAVGLPAIFERFFKSVAQLEESFDFQAPYRTTTTMFPRRSKIWALLYLIVCLNLVAAGPLGPNRRQDASSVTSEAPTTTQDPEVEQTTTGPDTSETSAASLTEATSVEVTTSTTSSVAVTAIPSALNGNNPSNDSFVNDTPIVPGELPLAPRLTPGWGVSGAILLITGIVYTLIGMKNAWLHTFFSSAYLASLCVTVLIVYVMNPPITDAIQGAYVVAVACSGIILGGAATAFRELTEGLGCLLGGFCFAMWLLTLHEGGLLPSTVGKVIFITAFTAVGFALYFSHYTRPYALIGLMSFAGATVTVLGIDCYSRAGLKEFWVYIWNLNDKLFPLDATTYPLTKGIKVEIAVIVVLTIIGIISQLKLWRVIQEHRAKRAEERAEFHRMREEEEAIVGRRVEEDNERERRQWETAYGDHPPSPTASHDSGVGEMEDEKKRRVSHTTVQPVSPSEAENKNVIEMAELPASEGASLSETAKQTSDGLVIVNKHQNNRVTIRVSRDNRPDGGDDESELMPEPDEKAWIAGVSEKSGPSSLASPRTSRKVSDTTAPEVIPLPFNVPESHEEDIDDGDRSSFATFADEDERSIAISKRASRASLSNRLSVSSGNLLRSLSQRSRQSQKSKRKTREFESPQPSQRWAESGEELVLEDQRSPEDTQSIAATIDGVSDNGDEKIESARDEESGLPIEIKAELADKPSKAEATSENKKPVAQSGVNDPMARTDVRPYSTSETVATDILNPSLLGDPVESKPERHSKTNATDKMEGTDETGKPANSTEAKAPLDTPKSPKSASPSVASSTSITKERLPSSLSRVALSYRTNEWAKHLSLAEKPEPETLQLNEYREHEEASKEREEVPAPVNVDELQQTAESGIPAALMTRSPSSMSNAQLNAPGHRSASRASVRAVPDMMQVATPSISPIGQIQDINDRSDATKGSPPHVLYAGYSARVKSRRQSGDVVIQPILEERSEHLSIRGNISQEDGDASVSQPNLSLPVGPELSGMTRPAVPGVVSYSSPQTLIGMREMFLRSKTQSSLLSSPVPEASHYAPRQVSQMEYPYGYPMPSPLASQDADDLPLSQRKELMRHNSVLSVNSVAANVRPNSAMKRAYSPGPSPTAVPAAAAESLQFDSHQPQRHPTTPSPAHREAQLASFRQSVAADLRANTPVSPATNGNGRETPRLVSTSSATLLGALAPLNEGTPNESNDIRFNIDQQRNALLLQREQEAQRREWERREKERNERAFEEMMRRGDLMDAHREAMRRMQSNVKE